MSNKRFILQCVGIAILSAMIAITVVNLVVAVNRNNNRSTYTKADTIRLITACENNGGPASECSCAIDKFESSFTSQEFMKEYYSYITTGTWSVKALNAMVSCE